MRKVLCQACQGEHMLCPQLCLPMARNVLGCDLYVALPKVRPIAVVKPNKSYDGCACYLCGKELVGARKKSVIKNRNNPGFWGVESEFKILCLKCLGRRFYGRMSRGKQKTFRKYLGRGYV